MILTQVAQYMAQRRRAPLGDIATHVGADADAVRGMIAILESKGRLRRVDGACGGGCCGCASSLGEIYEWIATAKPAASVGGRPGCPAA